MYNILLWCGRGLVLLLYFLKQAIVHLHLINYHQQATIVTLTLYVE